MFVHAILTQGMRFILYSYKRRLWERTIIYFTFGIRDHENIKLAIIKTKIIFLKS